MRIYELCQFLKKGKRRNQFKGNCKNISLMEYLNIKSKPIEKQTKKTSNLIYIFSSKKPYYYDIRSKSTKVA